VHRASAGLVFAFLSSACAPELVVGEWCPPGAGQEPGNRSKVVEAPWSTGFEVGFCDYRQSGGFCYTSNTDASFSIVNSPVHGGSRAAEFTVSRDPSGDGKQARCFLEGALPREARYGAWYYVPVAADNTGNWNLMHFQGGDDLHHLWDVSMSSGDNGSLSLYVFSFLHPPPPMQPPPPDVPIGSWFHVEFRLLRANDATGEVALYQDGALIYEHTGIATDDTDFAQWYVGNFSHDQLEGLPPSTLYVDDVTIETVP
jgi:hypothetical protein